MKTYGWTQRISKQNIQCIPIDGNSPTIKEIRKAIRYINSGELMGLDSMPAEELKTDLEVTLEMFHVERKVKYRKSGRKIRLKGSTWCFWVVSRNVIDNLSFRQILDHHTTWLWKSWLASRCVCICIWIAWVSPCVVYAWKYMRSVRALNSTRNLSWKNVCSISNKINGLILQVDDIAKSCVMMSGVRDLIMIYNVLSPNPRMTTLARTQE